MAGSVQRRLNANTYVVVDTERWRTTIMRDVEDDDDLALVTLGHDDMGVLTTAYHEIHNARRPLNTTDVSALVQNLAGDPHWRLRAVLNRPDGYRVIVANHRGGMLRRIRNWHDWEQVQIEGRG